MATLGQWELKIVPQFGDTIQKISTVKTNIDVLGKAVIGLAEQVEALSKSFMDLAQAMDAGVPALNNLRNSLRGMSTMVRNFTKAVRSSHATMRTFAKNVGILADNATRAEVGMTPLSQAMQTMASSSGVAASSVEALNLAIVELSTLDKSVLAGLETNIRSIAASFSVIGEGKAAALASVAAGLAAMGAQSTNLAKIPPIVVDLAQGINVLGNMATQNAMKIELLLLQIEKISKDATIANTQLNGMNKAMGNLAKTADKSGTKLVVFEKATDEAARSIAVLEAEIERLNKEMLMLGKNAKASGASMQAFSKGLNTVSTGLSQLVRGATSAAIQLAAIPAIGTAVYAGWEQQVRNTTSILLRSVDQTVEAQDELRNSIADLSLDMVKKFPVAAKTAAEGAYYFASAGLDLMQISDALPASIALSIATLTDLGEVSEFTAQMINAFNMKFADSGRAANALAAGISTSQATLEKLMTSMQFAAKFANIMNLTIEETVAALGKLYDNGIRASTAGTGFRRMIQGVTAETKKGEAALKKLNLSYDQIRNTLKTKGLPEFIKLFENAIASSSEKVNTLKIALDVFQLRGALPFIVFLQEGSAELARYTDEVKGLTKDQVLANMVAEQQNSVLFQLKAAWYNLSAAIIKFGKESGVFEDFAKRVKAAALNIVEFISNNHELIATLIKGASKMAFFLLAFAAVILPIATVTKLISASVAITMSLMDAWVALKAVMSAQIFWDSAKGLTAMNAAGTVTKTVLSRGAIAFGVIGVAMAVAFKYMDRYKDDVESLGYKLNFLGKAALFTAGAVNMVYSAIVQVVQLIAATIEAYNEIKGMGKSLFLRLLGLDGLADGVEEETSNVTDVIAQWQKNLEEHRNNAAEKIFDTIMGWANKIDLNTLIDPDKFGTSAGELKAAIEKIKAELAKLNEEAMKTGDGLNHGKEAFLNFRLAMVDAMGDVGVSIGTFKGFVNQLSDAMDLVKNGTQEAAEAVVGFTVQSLGGMNKVLSLSNDELRAFVSELMEAGGSANDLVDQFKAFGVGGKVFANTTEHMRRLMEQFQALVPSATGLFDVIRDKLGSQEVIDTFLNLINVSEDTRNMLRKLFEDVAKDAVAVQNGITRASKSLENFKSIASDSYQSLADVFSSDDPIKAWMDSTDMYKQKLVELSALIEQLKALEKNATEEQKVKIGELLGTATTAKEEAGDAIKRMEGFGKVVAIAGAALNGMQAIMGDNFAAMKAITIAEALINAYATIMASGKEGGLTGWALGMALFGQAMALIAKMRSIKPKKMAEGGIVTAPTRALIGEAGPEAVIPLKNLVRNMLSTPQNGGGETAVTLTYESTGDELVDIILDKIRAEVRTSGKRFLATGV